MAAVELESRDWSRLLPELLQEIAGHLTEIPDRIRFRCVCARWRSAAESIARPPRQLPWLLLPIEPDPEATDVNFFPYLDIQHKRRFWSFAEKRIYELPLIDCIQASLTASSHVWITPIAVTHSMPLPPSLPPFPYGIRPLAMRKAKIFSSSLPSSYDLVVAIMSKPAALLCRPGETSWKKIPADLYLPPGPLPPMYFAFNDNRFFTFNPESGVVFVFDIDTAQKTREIPVPQGLDPEKLCLYGGEYLVEMPFGELLLVIRMESAAEVESKTFRLFRLDKTKFEWIKISSIGDYVVFMDIDQAIAFDARGLSFCRRNSIYFVDSQERVVLLFDVEKGRMEEAPIFENKISSPTVWPHVSWIAPTIC